MEAQRNIQLTDHTENGATGVTFAITGSDANWTIAFTLSATQEGGFEIRIVGMVTQTASGSMPEGVMSNRVVVYYNTTSDVSARFGTVAYRDNGVVVVPVTFGENVIFGMHSFVD